MSITDLRSGELLRDAMVDTSKEHGECDTCGRLRNLDAGMCAMCEESAVPPESIAAEAMHSHLDEDYEPTSKAVVEEFEVELPEDGAVLSAPNCEFEGCDRDGIECPIDGRMFCPVHLNDHMEKIMDAQRASEKEDDDLPL